MTVYTIEQAEAWDTLVRGFSNYDVYYLSGYVKAFRLHGDGEPLLFYGEADGVRGINVVMKRDIAADPHFAGSLPANTYFDFATRPRGAGMPSHNRKRWLAAGGGGRPRAHLRDLPGMVQGTRHRQRICAVFPVQQQPGTVLRRGDPPNEQCCPGAGSPYGRNAHGL